MSYYDDYFNFIFIFINKYLIIHMNDQMLKAFYVPRRIRTFVEWLTATYTNRYTIGTFHTPYMVQYFFFFFLPTERIELSTPSLQDWCSTTELRRLFCYFFTQMVEYLFTIPFYIFFSFFTHLFFF